MILKLLRRLLRPARCPLKRWLLATEVHRPCESLEQLADRTAAGVCVRLMNVLEQKDNVHDELIRVEILDCLEMWVEPRIVRGHQEKEEAKKGNSDD